MLLLKRRLQTSSKSAAGSAAYAALRQQHAAAAAAAEREAAASADLRRELGCLAAELEAAKARADELARSLVERFDIEPYSDFSSK